MGCMRYGFGSSRRAILVTCGLGVLLGAPVAEAESTSRAEQARCEGETQACLDALARSLENYGWVGIEYEADARTGLLTVVKVHARSPAETEDFREGDVLLSLNGVSFDQPDKEALARAMQEARGDWMPGQLVEYQVRRDGAVLPVQVMLGRLPDHIRALWIGQHMLMHVSH